MIKKFIKPVRFATFSYFVNSLHCSDQSSVNRCENDRLSVSCQLHLLYIQGANRLFLGDVGGTPNYRRRNPPTIVGGTPLGNTSSQYPVCFSGLPRAVLEQLRAYKSVRLTSSTDSSFGRLTPYAFKLFGATANNSTATKSLCALSPPLPSSLATGSISGAVAPQPQV